MKLVALSVFVLSLVSIAQADIRIDGAYQGVVQSQGYGKASCSVTLETLDKSANSYSLKLSICSENSKSCMNAKFQAESGKSALAIAKLDQALVKAKASSKGSQVFKSEGYAYGGEETLAGRLNSRGELVQVLYTAGTGLYPVYIVCSNLVRN